MVLALQFYIHQNTGTIESLMQRLHICTTGVAKNFDLSFRKQPDGLSIQVALLVFSSFRKSDMDFLATLVK